MMSSHRFYNPKNIEYNGDFLILNFSSKENKNRFLKNSNILSVVYEINKLSLSVTDSSDESSSDSDSDNTSCVKDKNPSKSFLKIKILKKELSLYDKATIIKAIKTPNVSDFFLPSEIKMLEVELTSGKSVERKPLEEAELKRCLYILRHR